MNRIFKAIWNESTGTWVAASEMSRSKTKRKSSRGRLFVACAVVAGGALAGQAHADADDWTANPDGSLSVGGGSTAANGGVAIGSGTQATGSGSSAIAIGEYATASEDSSIAIGNGAQSKGAFSVANGGGSVASADNSIAVGSFSTASMAQAIAVGANATASGDSSFAAGAGANAGGTSSVAIGTNTEAKGRKGVAIGAGSRTLGGIGGVAIGGSLAGANSVALGTAAAYGRASVAIGEGTVAGVQSTPGARGTGAAVAIGPLASATGNYSVAIGMNSKATNDHSVALGDGSNAKIGAQSSYTGYNLTGTQASVGEVNVGNRTISGVAAGANDDEAVNVAQLKSVNTRIDSAVMYDSAAGKTSVTLNPGSSAATIHNVAAGAADTDAVNLGQMNTAIANADNPFFKAQGDRATVAASATGTHSVASGAAASAFGRRAPSRASPLARSRRRRAAARSPWATNLSR